ncbi:MAG: hypothetical protein AAFX87_04875 [Bacteroidota bacterium]
MNDQGLGIFNEFWDGHPNHLPLLRLKGLNSQVSDLSLTKSLQRLDHLCSQHSKSKVVEGIQKMLQSENWRLHLVAILASFKLPEKEQQDLISDLWIRLQKGSWVSPQILSVLSMIDEAFEIKARRILEYGFEVKRSSTGVVVHHHARGPEGSEGAAEKMVSSIKSLLENQEDDFGWKGNLINLITLKVFKTRTIQ